MVEVGRRAVLAAVAGCGASLLLARSALAETQLKKTADLKPGEFTWHPERSPEGPVAIIVSIPDQRVHVYRNGIRIGVSTCSTGAPGHSTPTGVFTILEKDKTHRSSTYNNAPMPNMNRLTWSGIAIHAGKLPGYPASHGCVRLPPKFSELLFGITHVGTPVILAGSHTDPREVVHPGLVLGEHSYEQLVSVQGKVNARKLSWAPEVTRAEMKPTSIIVSHADSSITVLEDGAPIAQGRATIANPDQPLGRHVFMLTAASDNRLTWHAISHFDQAGIPLGQPEEAVLQRIKADKPTLDKIHERMHAGLLLITTELPAHPDTRTGDDFVLMDAEAS